MLWAEACGPPTQDTGTEALPRGPRSLLAGAALHGAAGLPHGRLVDEHGVGGVAGLQQVLLPVLVGCRDMKGMGAGPRAPRGVGLDGLGGAVTAPGGTVRPLARGKPSGLGGPEGREQLCVSDALGDPGDAWLSPHRQR